MPIIITSSPIKDNTSKFLKLVVIQTTIPIMKTGRNHTISHFCKAKSIYGTIQICKSSMAMDIKSLKTKIMKTVIESEIIIRNQLKVQYLFLFCIPIIN